MRRWWGGARDSQQPLFCENQAPFTTLFLRGAADAKACAHTMQKLNLRSLLRPTRNSSLCGGRPPRCELRVVCLGTLKIPPFTELFYLFIFLKISPATVGERQDRKKSRLGKQQSTKSLAHSLIKFNYPGEYGRETWGVLTVKNCVYLTRFCI